MGKDNEKVFDFGEEMSKMLPHLIRATTRRHDSIFSSGELSIAHISIIEFLKEKGSSKMGDIAVILSLSMSAVTSIVDRMIEMKLVKRERSSEDRRVVMVELDEKGSETAKKIMDDRKKTVNDLFSALTEEEKKDYLRLLTKVYKGSGEEDA